MITDTHRPLLSDVQVTLDVGGSDKLAEDVCARREVPLQREKQALKKTTSKLDVICIAMCKFSTPQLNNHTDNLIC